MKGLFQQPLITCVFFSTLLSFSQISSEVADNQWNQNIVEINDFVKSSNIENISQSLEITVKPTTVERKFKENSAVIFKFSVPENSFFKTDNLITIKVDEANSTIPKEDYQVLQNVSAISVTKNGGNHEMIVNFLANSDRILLQKYLVFNVSISTSKKEQFNSLVKISVSAETDSIAGFQYLAYVGTNFDLIDGIKAKNLFFATNIFLAPKNTERTGIYFSIYGNRNAIIRDSIDNERFNILKAIRTDASNIKYAVYETADLKIEGYSDNLGVYVATLIRLWRQKESFQLYYSPSMEFVWRRNVQNLQWYNFRESEPDYESSEIDEFTQNQNILLKTRSSITNTIYDWNIGAIGIFLNHENSQMSIRLNMNVGPSFRSSDLEANKEQGSKSITDYYAVTYKENVDLFFSGKLWITERYTGITLQAEVTNYLKNTSPYYGVTLSKAINFNMLASLFQPITSR